MCGRYSLTIRKKDLAERFDADDAGLEHAPRYNVAPGQVVPVVVRSSPARLEAMAWGLVPAWAKDASIGARMINARAETLREKPAFRPLVERRRCLVPADGFYEWRPEPGARRKTPMRIARRDRAPFAFAGLWDRWADPGGGERRTFTILTTAPNELLRPIHDRMPAILRRADEARWLDPAVRYADLAAAVLEPFDAAALEAYEVSTLVNAPANDLPACVEPARGLRQGDLL